MSLEQELAKLTVEIVALREALDPKIQAAVAASKGKIDKDLERKAEAVAEKVGLRPEPKPEPAVETPDDDLTIDDVRELITEVAKRDKDAAKDLIAQTGFQKLSDVPENDYPDLKDAAASWIADYDKS